MVFLACIGLAMEKKELEKIPLPFFKKIKKYLENKKI
jgi:hypothetical protein